MCLGLVHLCESVQAFATAESHLRVFHERKRQIVPFLYFQRLVYLWTYLLAYGEILYYLLYWTFQLLTLVCLPINVLKQGMTLYLPEIVIA